VCNLVPCGIESHMAIHNKRVVYSVRRKEVATSAVNLACPVLGQHNTRGAPIHI